MTVTYLPFECEFVVMVAVIEGQGQGRIAGHVAGHAHETAMNAGLGHEITAGGQGREIDGVGQGHMIVENVNHENVYVGKINPIVAVPTMKSDM